MNACALNPSWVKSARVQLVVSRVHPTSKCAGNAVSRLLRYSPRLLGSITSPACACGGRVRATSLHFQSRQYPGVLLDHSLKRIWIEVERAQNRRCHLFRPNVTRDLTRMKRRIAHEQHNV